MVLWERVNVRGDRMVSVQRCILKDVTGQLDAIEAEGVDCPFLKRGEGSQRGGKGVMV
jgi:hypothetical protein